MSYIWTPRIVKFSTITFRALSIVRSGWEVGSWIEEPGLNQKHNK